MFLMGYTAGIVKWTQAEIIALNVSTRKLLTLHKYFSMTNDLHRLYAPRTHGGCGLLLVEDTVAQEKLALGRYLESSTEPWLQKVFAWCVISALLSPLLITRIIEFRKTFQTGNPSHFMVSFFRIYQLL